MLNFCKNPYFKCTLFCFISGGENYKIYVVAHEQFVGFLGVQLTSVLYTVRVQDPVTPDMELEPDTKAFKKEIDKMNIQGKQYETTAYRIKSLYAVSLMHTSKLTVTDRQVIETELKQTVANITSGIIWLEINIKIETFFLINIFT